MAERDLTGSELLNNALSRAQAAVEKWGWTVLLSAIAITVLWHRLLKPFVRRVRREMSLQSANAPERTVILDEDMRRKRSEHLAKLEQEQKLQGDEARAQARPRRNVAAPPTPPRAPPCTACMHCIGMCPHDIHTAYNPLDGAGGVSGFRPSGGARTTRRG
jgi:ferredoxin